MTESTVLFLAIVALVATLAYLNWSIYTPMIKRTEYAKYQALRRLKVVRSERLRVLRTHQDPVELLRINEEIESLIYQIYNFNLDILDYQDTRIKIFAFNR